MLLSTNSLSMHRELDSQIQAVRLGPKPRGHLTRYRVDTTGGLRSDDGASSTTRGYGPVSDAQQYVALREREGQDACVRNLTSRGTGSPSPPSTWATLRRDPGVYSTENHPQVTPRRPCLSLSLRDNGKEEDAVRNPASRGTTGSPSQPSISPTISSARNDSTRVLPRITPRRIRHTTNQTQPRSETLRISGARMISPRHPRPKPRKSLYE